MSAATIADLEKQLAHAWNEPKARAISEQVTSGLFIARPEESIDFDWFEPRHDQPWRRQVARDRDAFGGGYVAQPRAPVEGPNNPDRIARELERAEADLKEANVRAEEVADEREEAIARILALEERLPR